MISFAAFRKRATTAAGLSTLGSWRCLVSAFGTSDRITAVFRDARASRKLWLTFPEHRSSLGQIPKGCFDYDCREEDDFITEFLAQANLPDEGICIDCTGFLKPHLMFMLRALKAAGQKSVDVIYAEPDYYAAKEKTSFAGEVVEDLRPVRGFESSMREGKSDLLIVGSGYDPQLTRAICVKKAHARKLVLLGFPSLRPEMYQESLLRTSEAGEALGFLVGQDDKTLFAPANDPFATAAVVHDVVSRSRLDSIDELDVYLCPLGTKPQTLGLALYYLLEADHTSVTVYSPFASDVPSDPSRGIGKVWLYTIDFALLSEIETELHGAKA